MQRNDWYTLALGVLNVFIFMQFAQAVHASTVSAVVAYGSLWGYAALIVFTAGVVYIFRNLTALAVLCIKQENMAVVTRVAKESVYVLAAYVVFIFLNAYMLYGLYGA